MNDFDNNMKQRAGEFRIEPRGQVWERIEQELDSRKRRRGLVWIWWMLPLLLAGGGTFILWPGNGEQPQLSANTPAGPAHTMPTPTPHSTSSAGEDQATAKMQNPEPIEQGASEKIFAAPEPTGKHRSTPATPATAKWSPATFSPPVTLPPEVASDNTPAATPEKEQAFVTHETDTANLVESPLPVSAIAIDTEEITGVMLVEPIPEKQGDSLTLLVLPEISGTSEDSPAGKTGDPKRRLNWQVLAGVGLHNHTGGGLSLNKSMMEYNSGIPQNSSGQPGSQAASLEPTQAGPGFMLGAELSRIFGSKGRWNWMAGLHYQYQTIQITTGARRDSAISLDGSFSGNNRNTTANYFYRSGAGQSYIGSQHRMHLTAALQWYLHRNKQWLWQNGFYGGMVLASDYLYPQGGVVGWLPSKDIIRKGYFGFETGIRFQPARWGAGIYGQYNLTSSASTSLLSPQYWRGIELRIHYNISNVSPKK